MSVRLVRIHQVAREQVIDAAMRFRTEQERADFLGHTPDDDLTSAETFETLRHRWRCEEDEHWEDRPRWRVPQTRLVLVDDARTDGERVVGHVELRHRLTDGLRVRGGHVGYTVLPTERRRGYGSRALVLALPVARRIGIATVLVTCRHSNEPSRRIIEKAGATLVDRWDDQLRFVLSSDGSPPDTDIDALP